MWLSRVRGLRGLWLGVFLVMGFCTLAQAADDYSARIAVSDDSLAEQKRAASEALKEVFTRASGVQNFSAYPATQNIFNSAHARMERFELIKDDVDGGEQQQYFKARFTPSLVKQLLQQANIPVWPSPRPKVLVWLVEEAEDGTKTIINRSDAPVLQGLIAAQHARNLPLVFPKMDTDDRLAINPELLWVLDADAIHSASERYGTEVILVGRYKALTTGPWSGEWQYWHKSQSQNYDLNADSGLMLGEQALNPLIEHLIAGVTTAASENLQSNVSIKIQGVRNFSDFAAILKYLNKITVVQTSQLAGVSAETMQLNLVLKGSRDQFLEALTAGVQLKQIILDEAVDVNAPLALMWTGT